MAIGTSSIGSPVHLTASGVVAGGTAMARTFPGAGTQAENTSIEGTILGFYVNSTTSGTIVLSSNNGGAAGTAFTGTITPAIGWHSFPVTNPGGIFATIANTLDVTFIVVK